MNTKVVKWVDINGQEQETMVKESIPYSSRAAIIEEVVDAVMRNGYKPYMFQVLLRTSVYHEYTDYVVTDFDEMMDEDNLWTKLMEICSVANEVAAIANDVQDMIAYQKNRSGLDLIAEYLLGEMKPGSQTINKNESEGETPMN